MEGAREGVELFEAKEECDLARAEVGVGEEAPRGKVTDLVEKLW
jgi:hypothetical protein